MRLAELIGTLSLAADAGTGMPEEGGLRAAIVAAKVAELVGMTDRERSDCYYLALLRYSGCTSRRRSRWNANCHCPGAM